MLRNQPTEGPRAARGLFGVFLAAAGRKTHAPRVVGTGLAMVLTAGLVAVTAIPDDRRAATPTPTPARLPVTPPVSPGAVERLAIEPDFALLSAAVRRVGLEDELAEQVTFCFTRRVRQPGPAPRFTLLGPDVDTVVVAAAVDLLRGDSRCLLARFAPGTPVTRYTVAAALDGAARDGDAASVASTAPMAGTPPRTAVLAGGTSAPDLVSVAVDPTLDHLTLVYDEPLDVLARRRPEAFSYYSLSGQTHVADRVVSLESDTAVVAFTSPADDVEDAVRVAARAGAVRGRDARPAAPGVKDLRPPGGTEAPDLEQVERVPGSDVLWDFTFDEAVESPVPSRFALYAQDASASFGTAVSRPSPNVVRLVVPGVDDAVSEQVLAGVQPAAARDTGIGKAGSTLGVVPIGTYDATGGRTTGPDLLAAHLDARAGVLRLEFDEPLDDDSAPSPSAVSLVLPGGQRVFPTLVEVAGVHAILLVSDPAAEATARVLVDGGALRGSDGEASAPGSVVPS